MARYEELIEGGYGRMQPSSLIYQVKESVKQRKDDVHFRSGLKQILVLQSGSQVCQPLHYSVRTKSKAISLKQLIDM
jgi:hypothetical protein